MSGHDPKFAVWMAKVDAIVWKKAGVSAHDLPDFMYLDSFEDGDSPASAAARAIKAAKEF